MAKIKTIKANQPNFLHTRCGAAGSGVILLGAMLLSGCGKFLNRAEAPSAGSQRILVIAGDPQENWEGARRGALSAQKSFGTRVEWKTLDPKNPLASQKKLLTAAVKNKEIGVVLAPFDSAKMAPRVQFASQEMLPTAIFDQPIFTRYRLTYARNDHFVSGVLAARHIGKAMKGKRGRAGVLLTADNASSQQTARSFRRALGAEFKNIQVVDAAKTKTSGLEFVFAADELATVQALKDVAADSRLVAASGSEAAIVALRSGKLDALVIPNRYEMVREGIRAILQYRVQQPRLDLIGVPPVVVTRANFHSEQSRQVLGLEPVVAPASPN